MSTRHFTNKFNDDQIESTNMDKISLSSHAYEILMNCTKNQPPIHDHHDGGLYVGFQGHAYALLHLSKSCMQEKNRLQMLNLSKHLLEQSFYLYSHYKKLTDETSISFLLGRLGSVAVAGCVYNQLKCKDETKKYVEEFIKLGERFVPIEIFKSGSDELFVGRAGYLAGLILLRSFTEDTAMNFPKQLLYNILDSTIQSGQKYSQINRSQPPLMYAYYGTEYLGAGHGLMGILFMIMKFREYLTDRSTVVSVIQECLDYTISISKGDDGNLPPATEDINRQSHMSNDRRLVHWCHGGAGAIYAYARAYVLWKNEIYLKAAINCGEIVWKFGLLKKGPGICHGIAGSGYVFLTLYRLTDDAKYLHRAKCFFDFMSTDEFKSYARTPDCPYSLFEGWAGTSCFISDLATPELAHFPFFDIFD